MKKLFLTSGIIACMACPALADTYVQGGANQCIEPNIGVYTGTTNLQADWTQAYSTITLDKGTSETGYGSGNLSPTPLYGVHTGATGADKVYTGKDANNNLTGGVAEDAVILTNMPTGKQVKFNFNYNFSSLGDTYTAVTTNATSTTPNRTYLGVQNSAGTETYIGTDGKLTTEGLAAANALNGGETDTWYAKYKCETPVVTDPILTGYQFKGWAADAGKCGSASYTVPSSQCLNNDMTLFACWQATNPTVTYAANTPTAGTGYTNTVSGMPSPLSSTTTFDAAYNVAAAPSLTGYTFNGWASTVNLATGSGTQTYTGGEAISHFKAASGATLTAQWTAKTYNVTYSTVGRTGTAGTNYTHTNGATYDAAYTIPTTGDTGTGVTGAKAAASGYTFIGWTTNAEATITRSGAKAGTVANAWTGETVWRRTDPLTVYATYIANQGTITYNCGSVPTTTQPALASGQASTQTVTYNDSYELAGANKCTAPSGYTFGGWSCSVNLPGASKTLPAAGDVAKYVGGNAAAATTLYAAGATSTGWNSDAASLDNGVTCTAKWKSNVININWDDNHSTSGTIDAGSCTYSSSVTLPTTPTRTGYTFSGWKVNNPSQGE